MLGIVGVDDACALGPNLEREDAPPERCLDDELLELALDVDIEGGCVGHALDALADHALDIEGRIIGGLLGGRAFDAVRQPGANDGHGRDGGGGTDDQELLGQLETTPHLGDAPRVNLRAGHWLGHGKFGGVRLTGLQNRVRA